jgi:hypothetical protein
MKSKNDTYNDIHPFYVLSFYNEKEFVNANIDYDYENLSTINKLYLAIIYQNLNYNLDELEKITKDISNSTIIEAR